MKNLTNNISIVLRKSATGENFSLESGLADGKRNFDHHKPEHSKFPCPANDSNIPVVPENSVIEISHLDADTFVGLLRMLGKELPSVDLVLLEKIDLNGSSVCADKFHETLLYMVGIGQIARSLGFPRVNEEQQDVTAIIFEMVEMSYEEIIEIGREANKASEGTYENCCKGKKGIVGIWSIGKDNPFNPSRPYEDGIKVVIVFRSHYQSISIYCSPSSDFEFGGKTVADIAFAGHPKAAGSPRDRKMSEEDALKVYNELCSICN